MTRNLKIALGCGGAGCLGLIVVVVAAGLIYFYASRSVSRYANINFNTNSNRNVNLNSNTNGNDDSTNSNSSSSSADSLSEDDKHKLFQAAAVTGDAELQRRVWVKIGIMEEDFTQGNKFGEFAAAHISWSARNYQWVLSMDSAEKARAYINEHLPQ
ncbi:MAG TPA: hypothetical protein VHH35_20895 [Pyrinomonadaceae bacterium]|nr:hypothetical protein [Pyrinomonadaceae bacterium]